MALNDLGQIVAEWWKSLPEKYPDISLDEFIVMPNHMHGIVWIRDSVGAPFVGAHPDTGTRPDVHVDADTRGNINRPYSWAGARPAPTVSDIVGGFKSMTTVEYIRIQRNKNPKDVVPKLWQRSYHDRIIRTEKELEMVREYIRNNPSKWEEDEYLRPTDSPRESQ
jgi:REP element-mobilizing transposase RayT